MISSIPQSFQLFHSEVRDASYRSVGAQRQDENHCIFHYTVRGSGEVIYKGVSHLTHPGEGFFNIINDPCSGYGYPHGHTQPWEFVVICFEGGNTREIVSELLEKQVIYDLSAHQEVFRTLCLELSQKPLSSDIVLTCLPRLISMLRRENTAHLVRSFQQIVQRDLLLNPTISGIAAELNMTREHLQREYVRLAGSTPARYLSRQRFDKLCFLLMTPMPESEIAQIMHFPSVSGMAAFFKRYTGMTPKQYRRRGYVRL